MNTKFKKAVALAISMNLASIAAYSAPLNLTITAGGSIAASPAWENDLGSPVTNVTLDFSAVVASGNPDTDVDSLPVVIRLVNATAYPANAQLVRPSGCTIGSDTIVDASHVHFLNNGQPVSGDNSIAISSNGNQTYALRFAKEGHYGDKSGQVVCQNPGSLSYTY